MNRMIASSASALILFAGAASAQDTLFEQLPTLQDIVAADVSGTNSGNRNAETFTFNAPVEVTSVQWWGSYVPTTLTDGPTRDNFTLTFFDSTDSLSGTVPGSVIFQADMAVTAVDTGEDIAGVVNQYLYTATFTSPLAFDAGREYWIQILNNTGLEAEFPDEPLASWGWELGASVDGVDDYYAFRNVNASGVWGRTTGGTGNLALRLNGNVVPTPGTAAALAAAGLVALRRRR